MENLSYAKKSLYTMTLSRAIRDSIADAIAYIDGRTEIFRHDNLLAWNLHMISEYSTDLIKSFKDMELGLGFFDPKLIEMNELNYKKYSPIPFLHIRICEEST